MRVSIRASPSNQTTCLHSKADGHSRLRNAAAKSASIQNLLSAGWGSATTKRITCGTRWGRSGKQLCLDDQIVGRSHFGKRSRRKLQSNQVAKWAVARNRGQVLRTGLVDRL